jgi:hypothetical protein
MVAEWRAISPEVDDGTILERARGAVLAYMSERGGSKMMMMSGRILLYATPRTATEDLWDWSWVDLHGYREQLHGTTVVDLPSLEVIREAEDGYIAYLGRIGRAMSLVSPVDMATVVVPVRADPADLED